MSKKKPIDKAQARERRNRMLDAAAAAQLSLTEGVREMRAIAGMTQEEFAQHRGVSARVIKALELGQGNPTVATLNRIGQFFGLEVAFVPIKRDLAATGQPGVVIKGHVTVPPSPRVIVSMNYDDELDAIMKATEAQEQILSKINRLAEALDILDTQLDRVEGLREKVEGKTTALPPNTPRRKKISKNAAAGEASVPETAKIRSS